MRLLVGTILTLAAIVIGLQIAGLKYNEYLAGVQAEKQAAYKAVQDAKNARSMAKFKLQLTSKEGI